jgi:hypothetical protein
VIKDWKDEEIWLSIGCPYMNKGKLKAF